MPKRSKVLNRATTTTAQTRLANAVNIDGKFTQASPDLDASIAETQQNKEIAAGVLADPGFLDFGQGITEDQLITGAVTVFRFAISMHPVGRAINLAWNAYDISEGIRKTDSDLQKAKILADGLMNAKLDQRMGQLGRNINQAAPKRGNGFGAQKKNPAENPSKQPQNMQCFPSGTLVSTANGFTPIESIIPGLQVWAFDLGDAQWKLRTVLKTFVRDYKFDSIFVTVANDTIESTQLHPYWVISGADLTDRLQREDLPQVPPNAMILGRWVDAEYLQVGDILLLKNGRHVPIERIRRQPVDQKVYNFAVEELECYAVGTNQVLVHNINTPARAAALNHLAERL